MARRRWPLLLLVLAGWSSKSGLALVPRGAASPPPPPPTPKAVAGPTTPTTSCGAPLAPPATEHRPHEDSALDRFLIDVLAAKLEGLVAEARPPSQQAQQAQQQQWRRRPVSFAEFAVSTKALLAPPLSGGAGGGDAHLLRRSEQIAATLSGLVPGPLRLAFRATGQSRLACELHALLAPLVSGWLIGPARRVEGEIELRGPDGQQRQREVWTSSTKIERCRFFDEAGCRKACVYLCKLPTQQFFAETLGTPLTLTPDFEDGSCVMAFGQVPPPLDEDPVVQATRAMGSCCGVVGAVGGGPGSGDDAAPAPLPPAATAA